MLDKVLTGQLTFTSIKPCDLTTCTKADIRAYFENSYDLNESLFTALRDDSVFYKCPDRLRLPLIFYYAHTACVYVNKLILAGLLKPKDRVSLEYETLFETGVDEMSWDDTENYRMGGKFQWPRLDDVIEYRRQVRQLILCVIESTELQLPVTMASPWWGLIMGIEHERVHLETSSVLIRQLPVSMVTKPPGWKYGPYKGDPITETPLLRMTARSVTLGKPACFPSFGWDNCYGSLECRVPAFEAGKFLVTNEEFLEFVEAGGYKNRDYWSAEGWSWLLYRQAEHPTYWVCRNGCNSGCGADLKDYSHCKRQRPLANDFQEHYNGYGPTDELPRHLVNGQNGYCNGHDVTDSNGHQGKDEGGGQEYRLRCMFDEVPMPWRWPVEVNYLEAKAFCAWKGPDFRLPAEAEQHVIKGNQEMRPDDAACDIIFHDNLEANLNLSHGSSTPVNLYPPSATGFHDAAGNVWQWLEDHFNGLPGFRTSPVYDDFSCPCFDGRHNIITGGSWVSTGDEASRFARFAFRRHFFQHAGFRLARSLPAEDGGKVKLPVRLVSTPVFVLGLGVQENPIMLDTSKLEVDLVPTTYSQYVSDTESALANQLTAEYGEKGGHDFPAELLSICKEWLDSCGIRQRAALHLGCGTGRVSFGLAEYFEQVIGVDYSGRFVDVCRRLQSGDVVPYSAPGCQDGEARRPAGNVKGKLVFKQMTWMPNELGVCDFLLVTFLDRVQNAKSWTVRFPEVVLPDGLLVVASGGPWGHQELKPLIGEQFQLVADVKVCMNGNSQKTGHVTAWRHK